ncbi:2317_t:CDS:10 [Ambispora gerdemannii]|uniref:DNA-directed RNA polymerase subunit n=1 Tax=Ambispora gerdemannii TaxID=144530 RepID=A0A9N9BBB4_9GLOM|nr:2317_t:CDS:10 [Ambispora gerdemannii]
MKEQVIEQATKRMQVLNFFSQIIQPLLLPLFRVDKDISIIKNSEIEITQRDLYNEDRTPVQHSTLDKRLGPSGAVNEETICETCHVKSKLCVGHFGYIKLVLPIFHIGFFKATLNLIVLKNCSRVLLTENERRLFLQKLRRPNMEGSQRKSIVKSIDAQCKKVVECPYCGSINGVVKKCGGLKIVHEKFKNKKALEEQENFKKTFENAVGLMPEIKNHLNKAQEDMNPLKVLKLFQAVSSEDCELLGLDPENGRPELYIWHVLPVPPIAIRPSIPQENSSTEDDLTVKLSEIVFVNAYIKSALEKGAPIASLMEQWEFMQLSAAMYINSELPGISNKVATSNKPIRGLCQRLKGKQGRFRGNLSGKRVDFSGRTVISPDPNLRIDEVAIPDLVAMKLTYPEKVFEHNIEKLRKCIIRGPKQPLGAVLVWQSENQHKKTLQFADRFQVAKELKIGDIVERHLEDGDIVLFNRQPSLHKLSIMAHYVKVKPGRTFRFNECVCNPYNADFDGDEMNLHVPQTEEARTEAIELMGVKNNLVTPRNGEPIIAAIQDFITASYLLTKKGVFYDRSQFVQICSYMSDANLHIDIPPPTILKPFRLWTGKQIFNVLMRPNKSSPVLVNLENKGRSFEKKDGVIPELCPNEGYVVIRNSELVCGVVDKSLVGDGNKHSLFYTILRDYGSDEAANAMNRLSKLCSRWLANQGFSIGIDDVMPGEELRTKKEKLIEFANIRCDELIQSSISGKLENQSGCNKEQTLEAHISGVLSKVRDDAGQICMTELNKHNAPLIMATCGSKGSKINVSQMVACVGQQIISGSRIPDGFQDRSLPHFLKHSKTPAARGFVRNSFFSGLSPPEFLFHAVSGREGLVDTAVKTAETGYMQRRLMKALEDLVIHYDTSVRTSSGNIVQFCYGDDGLDPTYLEGEIHPVDLPRNLQHALGIIPRKKDKALLPNEILDTMQKELESPKFSQLCTQNYIESVRKFVDDDIIKKLEDIHQKYAPKSLIELDDDSKKIINGLLNITCKQLLKFFDICRGKYLNARIEPGTAVGAVGAQSIGEPGTQMTLKTFHFAGVASMNITLGVPRIKEIINASKTISTPIITCKLVSDTNLTAARIVKARLETTYLGDIAKSIEEVYKYDDCFLTITLDLEAIQKLQLEIGVNQVAQAIINTRKLKLNSNNITVLKADHPADQNQIIVHVSQDQDNSLYFKLQVLRRALPKVIVKGIPTVTRAVISEEKGTRELLVEGYGLQDVMTTEGIVGTATTSNNVNEVQKYLGIEAARTTIINEIQYTMTRHGMSIDPRHVKLLGDIMTYKGQVLGIHRFGVANMKDSVLMLASFEKTTDHLFDASLYGQRDSIEGVSESIIMGMPIPIGTGLFKLLRESDPSPPKTRNLLFDSPEYHVPVSFA